MPKSYHHTAYPDINAIVRYYPITDDKDDDPIKGRGFIPITPENKKKVIPDERN